MAPRTYLTDRVFAYGGLASLVGLLALVLAPAIWIHLGLLGVLAAALWVDRSTLPEPQALSVRASLPRAPELGKEVEVEFRVTAASWRAFLSAAIRLIPPRLETLELSDLSLPVRLRTMVDEQGESRIEAELRTRARAVRLGYEELRAVRLLVRSRWKLWSRVLEITTPPAAFRVTPSGKPISMDAFRRLLAQQRVFLQGSRALTRGQAADQFRSIRRYEFPDPIRHIDAKKTARLNRPMTRVFDSYHQHHVAIAVDLGRTALGEISGSSRSDFHLSAALALAESGIRQGDRVSFIGFSQKVRRIIPVARGMEAFFPLFRGDPELRPLEEESSYDDLLPCLNRVSGKRSILIILTDIFKPSVQQALLAALPSLCRQHLVAIASVIDRRTSLEDRILAFDSPTLTVERYNELLYSYFLDEEAKLFRARISSFGSGMILASERDWLGVMLRLSELLRSSFRA